MDSLNHHYGSHKLVKKAIINMMLLNKICLFWLLIEKHHKH